MPITAEQLKVARQIHAKVKTLLRPETRLRDVITGMGKEAERFEQLLAAVGHKEMLKLAKRYDGIWSYVKLTARIADAVESGAIPVPPELKEEWESAQGRR